MGQIHNRYQRRKMERKYLIEHIINRQIQKHLTDYVVEFNHDMKMVLLCSVSLTNQDIYNLSHILSTYFNWGLHISYTLRHYMDSIMYFKDFARHHISTKLT